MNAGDITIFVLFLLNSCLLVRSLAYKIDVKSLEQRGLTAFSSLHLLPRVFLHSAGHPAYPAYAIQHGTEAPTTAR
jgi:hypothetical protein